MAFGGALERSGGEGEKLPARTGNALEASEALSVEEFTELREKTGLSIRISEYPGGRSVVALMGENGATLTQGEFEPGEEALAREFYTKVCSALRDFAATAADPKNTIEMRKFLASYTQSA